MTIGLLSKEILQQIKSNVQIQDIFKSIDHSQLKKFLVYTQDNNQQEFFPLSATLVNEETLEEIHHSFLFSSEIPTGFSIKLVLKFCERFVNKCVVLGPKKDEYVHVKVLKVLKSLTFTIFCLISLS
jgi:hypothetical protein